MSCFVWDLQSVIPGFLQIKWWGTLTNMGFHPRRQRVKVSAAFKHKGWCSTFQAFLHFFAWLQHHPPNGSVISVEVLFFCSSAGKFPQSCQFLHNFQKFHANTSKSISFLLRTENKDHEILFRHDYWIVSKSSGSKVNRALFPPSLVSAICLISGPNLPSERKSTLCVSQATAYMGQAPGQNDNWYH